MGLSSSSTKTKQSQDTSGTTSGTTTPVAPDWLTGAAQDYVGRIADFGQTDPNSYVAGASPLQQQAWGNVGQLNGWQPQASTASGLAFDAGTGGANLATKQPSAMGPQVAQAPAGTGGQARPPGLLSPEGYSAAPSMPGYAQPRSGMPIGTDNPAITGASQAGAYSNPFDQQVINTTLAGYDQDAAARQAAYEAAGARNGAFGGSRFGIGEGQLGADLALGRGQLESGLRQTGFNTANQFGMQDAGAGNQMLQFNANQQDNADNRQLQAAGLLGDLSNNYDANTRADLGIMSGLGEQQRGIESAYAAAPLSQLESMGQLSGMTPYDILVGRNTSGTQTGTMSGTNVTSQTPSLFNQLLSGAQLASMFI